VIRREIREQYILVSEQADAGDLSPMIDLFVTVQKRALTQALSISHAQ
jgi:hypothetical protein